MAQETLTLEGKVTIGEEAYSSLISRAHKLTPQRDEPAASTIRTARYSPGINFERIVRRIENSHDAKDFKEETEIIYWLIGSAAQRGYITGMESAHLSTSMTSKARDYNSARASQSFIQEIEEKRRKKALLANYRRVPGHS